MRERTHPGPYGIVSLSRLAESAPMIDLARRVVEYFGFSGLGAVQMLQDQQTGEPIVMEVNSRPTPVSYIGEVYGVDLIAHMRAAIANERAPAPSEPRFRGLALFPTEWLRDPDSPELRNPSVYHDVPWDQPELLKAIVRMSGR